MRLQPRSVNQEYFQTRATQPADGSSPVHAAVGVHLATETAARNTDTRRSNPQNQTRSGHVHAAARVASAIQAASHLQRQDSATVALEPTHEMLGCIKQPEGLDR